MRKIKKQVRGITLVALVVTIIVLLILSGVVLTLSVGHNGIFNRAEKSANEYNRQEATEKVNLKITSTQIRVYAESERMPTLQEIADDFCEDNEVQYVVLERQKTANIEKIEVGHAMSIFTKLKEYPYEFEIDRGLRLASIDGMQLSDNENEFTISKKEYEELIKTNQDLTKSNEELIKNNEELTKSNEELIKNNEELIINNAELLKTKEEYEEMKNNMPKLLGVFTAWKEGATWNNAGLSTRIQMDDNMATFSSSNLTIKEKRKISYFNAIC